MRPDLIREHSNIELSISQSGYGRKQLNELIQNAADAMSDNGGRITVVLTKDALYCANEGVSFTDSGYQTLMLSHSSDKRDDQIGRFGLGFKSVLQISDEPQIYSRSASVKWSTDRSRQLLESRLPGLTHYPTLRLAEAVDPTAAAENDTELAELMSWASTVVKLPLRDNVTWISEELDKFPHHFLLFSPSIHALEVIDQTTNTARTWTSARDGQEITITDGSIREKWLLLDYVHQVSPAAQADAGSIFARNEVKVSWAVPLEGNPKRQRGRFWNYFETQHQTSLRGIINAAFKMNEDRVSMLETLYNKELLTKAVPRMVAAALPLLSTTADPAAHFDVLPSRDKETFSWADTEIYAPIMEVLALVPAVPNRSGQLRPIAELHVQPEIPDSSELAALWDAAVGDSGAWVHQSALSNKDRSSLVNRILSQAKQKRSTIREWLEEVVHGGELQDHENALEIAAVIIARKPDPDTRAADPAVEMRRSKIVLMSDGRLEAPIVGRLDLPTDPDEIGESVVSYELVHHGNSLNYLKTLGLEVLDGNTKLKKIIRSAVEDYADSERAESLWRVARTFPVANVLDALTAFAEPEKILVRRKDGRWGPLGTSWLSGRMLSADRPRDQALVVDQIFHGRDIPLFERLGVRSTLPEQDRTASGTTYLAWKTAEAIRLSKESAEGPEPFGPAGVRFTQAFMTQRLDELADASDEARTQITTALLSRKQFPTRIEFTSQYKPAQDIEGPDLWWVRQHGVFTTPVGRVQTKYCSGAPSGFPTDFLPFPGIEEAAALRLPTDTKSLQWTMITGLVERQLPLEKIHTYYGLLAKFGIRAPKELLVLSDAQRTTRFESGNVQLALDETSYEYMSATPLHGAIYVKNPDLRDALVDAWQLKGVTVNFSVEFATVESTNGERLLVDQIFPFLSRASKVKRKTICVPCISINRVTRNNIDDSVETEPINFHLDSTNSYAYYCEDVSPRRLLAGLLDLFGDHTSPSLIQQRQKQLEAEAKKEDRNRVLKNEKDPAKKLELLVGRDALISLVPSSVQSMLEQRDIPLTSQLIFDLVRNLYGTDLMQKLAPALKARGVDDPSMFQGRTAEARAMLKGLGFSPDLIHEPAASKPQREEVIGPVRLKELHEYQKSTSAKIKELLAGTTKNSRGVVQLPTGAGKTRVAAQSVIEHVAMASKPQLVVWIAHSEELCEQAIEAWTSVWQAVGPMGGRMAVSRLWGGNTARQETTNLHLVVATIQTLSNIADDVERREARGIEYSWLGNPDLVIIDEAHGAIAKSYTGVLKWMNRSARDTTRPLLGLSATPYRGTNELETERLVNRFQANLIEPDQFNAENAHEYLQGISVLAKVRHEILEGIELTPRHGVKVVQENEDDAKNAMLDQRVDLDRVAQSAERNERILTHLAAHSHSINHALIFAASVDHAEALAAVLSATGTPAAAISGRTRPSQRRNLIERFRGGDLKVLTNFDVLSQGFDAPKVDAIYLCRPTFSPNKYIQMVGRGLRGVANGGSEEVLVVNIQDNLDQFGEKLAFTEFDYLWNREPAHA
ncbi:hypothetical protein B5P43_32850 [Bacillus sp. SRB_336]|nr:hypothetical protein B5P43_32850 [Bacillus sp. SRB_336]